MPATLLLLLAVLAAPLEPAYQARYDRALALYDAGKAAEAAAELESLATDSNAARMVFEAGQARFVAGHFAHAWQHFDAYMRRRDISEDDRSICEGRLEKAAAAIRPIHVRPSPTNVATTVVAVRLGDPPQQQRPELAAQVIDGVAVLRLDPGPWDLRITAPGHLPVQHHLDVVGTGAPLEVPIVLMPIAPTPVAKPVDAGAARRAAELRRARKETIAGAVILPFGLAALGGFVATVARRQDTRAGFEAVRRAAIDCDVRDELGALQTRARRETVAMIGLGVAAGALLTTGAVLLVHGKRRATRNRLALDLRPGVAGFVLSGSF